MFDDLAGVVEGLVKEERKLNESLNKYKKEGSGAASDFERVLA